MERPSYRRKHLGVSTKTSSKKDHHAHKSEGEHGILEDLYYPQLV